MVQAPPGKWVTLQGPFCTPKVGGVLPAASRSQGPGEMQLLPGSTSSGTEAFTVRKINFLIKNIFFGGALMSGSRVIISSSRETAL